MKILKVVHTFLPDFYGGTEVLVNNLCERLSRKNKLDLFFCNPLAKTPDYSIKKKQFKGFIGWEVQKNIHKYKKFEETYLDKKIEEVFRLKLEELKPELVHFHHLIHLSANLPNIAKEFNVPVVLTLHDFWFQCLSIKRVNLKGEMCTSIKAEECSACIKRKHQSNLFEKLLVGRLNNKSILNVLKKVYLLKEDLSKKVFNNEKKIEIIRKRNDTLLKALNSCDVIIAPTKYLFNEFKEWGVNSDKLMYLADGIEDKYFKNIEKSQSNKFRFAFIGAIVPEKGLHVLIDAFNKINNPDILLYVFGSLDCDKRYSKEIKEKCGLNERIIFKGTFPPTKIGKIFRSIDCLVLPSIWMENSPLVVKNALLAKTPVIASDIPGVQDDINNNENGLLFEIKNDQDLKDKMLQMIKKNNYLRIKGNIKSPKTVKDNVMELEGIYNKLLDK